MARPCAFFWEIAEQHYQCCVGASMISQARCLSGLPAPSDLFSLVIIPIDRSGWKPVSAIPWFQQIELSIRGFIILFRHYMTPFHEFSLNCVFNNRYEKTPWENEWRKEEREPVLVRGYPSFQGNPAFRVTAGAA